MGSVLCDNILLRVQYMAKMYARMVGRQPNTTKHAQRLNSAIDRQHWLQSNRTEDGSLRGSVGSVFLKWNVFVSFVLTSWVFKGPKPDNACTQSLLIQTWRSSGWLLGLYFLGFYINNNKEAKSLTFRRGSGVSPAKL